MDPRGTRMRSGAGSTRGICSLYRSPNIVRVINPRRLRWEGHVARMEECRSDFKMLTGNRTGKGLLGRPRRIWNTILEWILNK